MYLTHRHHILRLVVRLLSYQTWLLWCAREVGLTRSNEEASNWVSKNPIPRPVRPLYLSWALEKSRLIFRTQLVSKDKDSSRPESGKGAWLGALKSGRDLHDIQIHFPTSCQEQRVEDMECESRMYAMLTCVCGHNSRQCERMQHFSMVARVTCCHNLTIWAEFDTVTKDKASCLPSDCKPTTSA